MSSWAHTAAGINADYIVFDLPASFPDVVCVDTPAKAIYVEGTDIESFVTTFESLWENEALDSKRTINRITDLMKDRE